jgi:hypothetical protein
MTFDDRIDAYQSRCQPQLLRLRLLTYSDAPATLPRQVSGEVREATNAVIAEAEAAGRAALGGAADSRAGPDDGTFLWVRLARLAEAADEAVRAAHDTDLTGLSRCLNRFEALTTAMWTVQHAVYGGQPAHWRRPTTQAAAAQEATVHAASTP